MKVGDLVTYSYDPAALGVIVKIDRYDVYVYDFVANAVCCDIDYNVVVISEA